MADVDAATATMIANLEANTGKSLDQWIALARASGQAKHGQLVAWLKAEQGLTHGYANLVAHKTFASDAGSSGDDDLMATMFAGPKAAMKPAYDKAATFVQGLDSVEFAPKKGYVSLRRSKQFALLQPSTKDRLDVGLVLKGVEPAGRLEAAGSWNAMVTHRVRVSSVDEVDAELEGWLRQAWAAA
ncbi:DUF4287 domain-containing protein [Brevundimonas halotolerans]|uniref:DUF5655 domain-containing protein n=1 Tax=Brevundimonas halotolerans TaxID=69670 RepID=A0A7W9A226_9CAUL|nr:DUF4287 domain-containing protein [Brevundimonas halotolerans]MBB5660012.1 hypothetical protein [Brevundimonas halotolerans]